MNSFYRIRKIHKSPLSFRLIIAANSYLLVPVSHALSYLLQPIVAEIPSITLDSKFSVRQLEHLILLEDDFVLLTFDVEN